MANAEYVVGPTTIVLELTMREAKLIHALVGEANNQSDTQGDGFEKEVDAIFDALNDVGIQSDDLDVDFALSLETESIVLFDNKEMFY